MRTGLSIRPWTEAALSTESVCTCTCGAGEAKPGGRTCEPPWVDGKDCARPRIGVALSADGVRIREDGAGGIEPGGTTWDPFGVARGEPLQTTASTEGARSLRHDAVGDTEHGGRRCEPPGVTTGEPLLVTIGGVLGTPGAVWPPCVPGAHRHVDGQTDCPSRDMHGGATSCPAGPGRPLSRRAAQPQRIRWRGSPPPRTQNLPQA